MCHIRHFYFCLQLLPALLRTWCCFDVWSIVPTVDGRSVKMSQHRAVLKMNQHSKARNRWITLCVLTKTTQLCAYLDFHFFDRVHIIQLYMVKNRVMSYCNVYTLCLLGNLGKTVEPQRIKKNTLWSSSKRESKYTCTCTCENKYTRTNLTFAGSYVHFETFKGEINLQSIWWQRFNLKKSSWKKVTAITLELLSIKTLSCKL